MGRLIAPADLTHPGVVNDQAIRTFTQGYCLALAQGIHRNIGWPIWVLGRKHKNGALARSWAHAVVSPEPGMFLDIEGYHTERGLLARWVDRGLLPDGWAGRVRPAPELQAEAHDEFTYERHRDVIDMFSDTLILTHCPHLLEGAKP